MTFLACKLTYRIVFLCNRLATKIYELVTKLFLLVASWLLNKKLILSPAEWLFIKKWYVLKFCSLHVRNGKSWNQAMIPHVERETGTCHTELTVERGREGREGNAWRCAFMQNNFAHCKCYHCERCHHTSQSGKSGILVHGYIKTSLTAIGMQTVFVVNSGSLHLIAFKTITKLFVLIFAMSIQNNFVQWYYMCNSSSNPSVDIE